MVYEDEYILLYRDLYRPIALMWHTQYSSATAVLFLTIQIIRSGHDFLKMMPRVLIMRVSVCACSRRPLSSQNTTHWKDFSRDNCLQSDANSCKYCKLNWPWFGRLMHQRLSITENHSLSVPTLDN